MTVGDFLKTKNVYYSGIAGLVSGLMGGQLQYTAIISPAIAAIDVACFPKERPDGISGGKWFLGNLLSSTASGLIAWGVGHGVHDLFSDKDDKEMKNFTAREKLRRALTPCGCERTL